MNDIFTNYPDAGAGAAARKQAVNQVNMNIEWVRARGQNFFDALEALAR